jgi:hypothetical protein
LLEKKSLRDWLMRKKWKDNASKKRDYVLKKKNELEPKRKDSVLRRKNA